MTHQILILETADYLVKVALLTTSHVQTKQPITKENLPNYNNPAESATDAYQSQFGTMPPNEPLTFGSMMGNIKD